MVAPHGPARIIAWNTVMAPKEIVGATSATKGFSPWRIVPLVVLAAGFIAFFALGLDRYLSFEALGAHRDALLSWSGEHRVLVVLSFIALYGLVVALSVPGAIWMTLGAGFLFGTVAACAYVVVSATLGAAVIFLAAKYALGDYLRGRAGPAIKRLESGFRENEWSYMLVLRLVPLFPFWLVNLAPAFLDVRIRVYVICTFFGIIPGTFVYASIGNGLGSLMDAGTAPDLGVIFEPEILLPLIGLAVLSVIPVAYKRYKGRKAA